MSEEEYFQKVYEGVKNYCRSTNNVFIAPSRAGVIEAYYNKVSVRSCLKDFIEEWYTDGK